VRRLTFTATTLIPATAEAVFAWHEAPGAFERLTPPWERVQVLRHEGGIRDGAAPFDPLGQVFALHQLHHQCALRRLVRRGERFDAVDLGEVRMVQRGERARLPVESHEAFGVHRQRCGQDLQRDVATESGVGSAVDFAHAAGSNPGDDLEGTVAGPGRERHS
jgi:hypothetical protein